MPDNSPGGPQDNVEPRSMTGGADIVERLRWYGIGDLGIHDTCREAADEIERLRAALEKILTTDKSSYSENARRALKGKP